MPCYRPLKGYRARIKNKSGKRSIVFKAQDGYLDMPVEIPCGQCQHCRLERSRQWAIRCVHEAQLHPENAFITLTYNDDHVPKTGTLIKKHLTDFWKRYRRYVEPRKIRYYACGEYGEENYRPHYHACVFGHDFSDKSLFKVKDEVRLYVSPDLAHLWPYGFSTIGDVTFRSAAYVARYIMKKVNGEQSEEHYRRVDPETGELYQVIPEFTTMSRRPGIGAEWLEKYETDAYPSDYIIINGSKMRPPKYYDTKYEEIDEIKKRRKRKALKHKEENTPERLAQREKYANQVIKQLKRTL